MTEEELQRIRERAEKAAPGPWRVEDGLGLLGITSDAVPFVLGSFHPRQRDEAEFVAYAREDIPTLLAEVEQLREIVQAVAAGPADSDTYLCNYCDEYIGGIFGQTTHKADCPVTKARQLLSK